MMGCCGVQGGLRGVMRLLEGDEFVRGILEPAGLTLEDMRHSQAASLRRISTAAASAARAVGPEDTDEPRYVFPMTIGL